MEAEVEFGSDVLQVPVGLPALFNIPLGFVVIAAR